MLSRLQFSLQERIRMLRLSGSQKRTQPRQQSSEGEKEATAGIARCNIGNFVSSPPSASNDARDHTFPMRKSISFNDATLAKPITAVSRQFGLMRGNMKDDIYNEPLLMMRVLSFFEQSHHTVWPSQKLEFLFKEH